MKISIVLIFCFQKDKEKKLLFFLKASDSYINWISDENTIIIWDAYTIKKILIHY